MGRWRNYACGPPGKLSSAHNLSLFYCRKLLFGIHFCLCAHNLKLKLRWMLTCRIGIKAGRKQTIQSFDIYALTTTYQHENTETQEAHSSESISLECRHYETAQSVSRALFLFSLLFLSSVLKNRKQIIISENNHHVKMTMGWWINPPTLRFFV